MKHTCLSKGGGFYFPPCHIINVCGFQVLIDCPIDLSAIRIFSPIPTESYRTPDIEISDTSVHKCSSLDSGDQKRRKTERTLEVNDLICAEPWYKTVKSLHLWDVTFIDVVLISSPMGMLGLPFLTRNNNISAKVFATQATARLGQLMMEDLVSMHMEFMQFYGPEESGCPQWMKWEELGLLPSPLKEIASGNDGSEVGSWFPLYSAADVKDCIQKVQVLKYAEEACYNGILNIQALSSGVEIGSSNWTINGPQKRVAYVSSSIFESTHAMNFNYHSLQGSDLILFSDFSALLSTTDISTDANCSAISDKKEETIKSLHNTDESLEEMEKLAFLCSCIIDSIKEGGSVLIPIGRVGIVLEFLEQVSLCLESSSMKVPIFIISSIAEEMLSFTNVVPEWLCEQRQQRLYSGEPLFAHVELIKQKKVHLFPSVHSHELLSMWQEPCIVFCPHWSLRLGPAVHLLRRWCGDQHSLLVLEQEVDVDLALLPFKPMAMKVLQCSFLSGIKFQKIGPLLEMLQPKFVLFPEDLRSQILISEGSSCSVYSYIENETSDIPCSMDAFEADVSTDLAFQLQWRTLTEEDIAIARLKGELFIEHGKHLLLPGKDLTNPSQNQLLHWGSLDPALLLEALRKKGINGSIDSGAVGPHDTFILHIGEPNKALIQIQAKNTLISAADENTASLILEVMNSVLGGI